MIFNSNNSTSIGLEEIENCRLEDDLKYLPVENGILTEGDQKELEDNLGAYMSCFGVEEKYNVEIFNESCRPSENAYCCAIGPLSGLDDSYMLGVSFAGRDEYTNDQMKPMIVSSILIFLLLAFVSYLILWSLAKQKKITENNIDFFNNTAHELKTPLTNISLALKLLELNHSEIRGEQNMQRSLKPKILS